MDDIVRQAMSKWPNVPHCFGWLRLDARGDWRMRDERTQQLNLPGDRISHPALLAFISRNYAADEQGRWYFQNGPQRVYVDLELAPTIIRTQPVEGNGMPALVLHTGETVNAIETALMDEEGRLYVVAKGVLGAIDDRDLMHLLPHLQIPEGGDEDALLAWIEKPQLQPLTQRAPQLTYHATIIDLQRVTREELPARFGFTPIPRAD